MRITDLLPGDEDVIQQVAALLVEGFAADWPAAWPDMDAAVETVRASFGEDRISRVALDDAGSALGWVGGMSQYDGHVWELHPLVVARRQQGQGIGRALVADLEECVRARGALTIILGSDDETGQTTLSDVNLLPDVWTHIARVRNLRRHPYEFYQTVTSSIKQLGTSSWVSSQMRMDWESQTFLWRSRWRADAVVVYYMRFCKPFAHGTRRPGQSRLLPHISAFWRHTAYVRESVTATRNRL